MPVGRAVRPADRARRASTSSRTSPRPRASGCCARCVFAVFPHPRRLRAALALPQPARAGPVRAAAASSRRRGSAPAWPPRAPARPTGRASALLTGCVQSVVFGDVNAATARVLAADGYEVTCRARRGAAARCTRTPAAASEGVARARAARAVRSPATTTIVTNAAGCGSHLKDHGVDERRRRLRAARRGPRARSGSRSSCASRSRTRATCARAAACEREPRGAARAIPGLELRRAGRAGALLRQRRASTTSSSPRPRASSATARRRTCSRRGPDAYASANPGCLLQVTAALRRAGTPLAGVPPGRAPRRVDPRRRRRRAAPAAPGARTLVVTSVHGDRGTVTKGATAAVAAQRSDAQGSSPETSTSP